VQKYECLAVARCVGHVDAVHLQAAFEAFETVEERGQKPTLLCLT
jgi:hypothetical protein